MAYKKCSDTHPAMPLGDHVIYGGACANPVVTDADIYVGLDYGFSSFRSPKAYPWEEGESFLYMITDMCAPKDPESFKQLILWIAEKLQEGKKVHVGCIGGHGRTGLVLAALVKHVLGIEDAITYVRKNYCQKAVESRVQVDFLHKHWGIKKVQGHKESSKAQSTGQQTFPTMRNPPVSRPVSKPAVSKQSRTFLPCRHPVRVWGSSFEFDK